MREKLQNERNYTENIKNIYKKTKKNKINCVKWKKQENRVKI